jgi:hypothetical protein
LPTLKLNAARANAPLWRRRRSTAWSATSPAAPSRSSAGGRGRTRGACGARRAPVCALSVVGVVLTPAALRARARAQLQEDRHLPRGGAREERVPGARLSARRARDAALRLCVRARANGGADDRFASRACSAACWTWTPACRCKCATRRWA